jgi:hypothetical protein
MYTVHKEISLYKISGTIIVYFGKLKSILPSPLEHIVIDKEISEIFSNSADKNCIQYCIVRAKKLN